MIPALLLILADVATASPTPPPAGDGGSDLKTILPWVTTFVVAVIAVVSRQHAKSQGVQEGRSQAMHVTNQPLIVALEEKFVTREDFREFKADTRTTVAELGGLFRATMAKIEERDRAVNIKIDERDKALVERIEDRDEKLTSKIEQVARGAYEGRGRIHQTVNEHSKQIAAIAENADVAKEIGKLAIELKKRI